MRIRIQSSRETQHAGTLSHEIRYSITSHPGCQYDGSMLFVDKCTVRHYEEFGVSRNFFFPFSFFTMSYLGWLFHSLILDSLLHEFRFQFYLLISQHRSSNINVSSCSSALSVSFHLRRGCNF